MPHGTDDDGSPSQQFLRSRLRMLLLFLLLGYGVMCLLSCTLILYLRANRRSAFSGDQAAARKVILPAFEPLLVVLGAATFVYVVYISIAFATDLFASNISKVATEIFYSGRQFVLLSVIIFILQSSVSIQALQRSVLITLVLATYTIPIVALLVHYSVHKQVFYLVLTTSRGILLLLYVGVFIKPPCRASKQALREFCLYAFVYYALLFGYNAMFYQQNIQCGFLLTYANLVWGSLSPLVIWRVLHADTEYWRRLGQRAVALQQNLSCSASSVGRNVFALECISASGSHVLVEMHRKYVIDFAYLELQHAIGRCSRDAIVYRGVLRGARDVAAKVYTPPQLDEETIAQFSQQAALCGALHHPNIVQFVGLCVRPPTICLLSELCSGSLADVTIAKARKHSRVGRSSRRQQLLINIAYMLDAARAVAYLHSFTPAFLHRDIKPTSFLVDSNNTVKLTDFGDSRSVPLRPLCFDPNESELTARKKPTREQQLSSTLRMDLSELDSLSPSALPSSTGDWQQTPPRQSRIQAPGNVMTIKGTVEYMAPELLLGHAGHACYGEAVDVYALAVTMWDILYPGKLKYPQAGDNHFKAFEMVLAGARPPVGDEVPPTLRELLRNAWHEDPRLRPTADHVVGILESLQEEVGSMFAQRLYTKLAAHKLLTAFHTDSDHQKEIVHGAHVAEMLVTSGYTDDGSEALRLGNLLLDASVIHHATHARPFETSSKEAYYFDMSMIHANGASDDALARSWRGHKRNLSSKGSWASLSSCSSLPTSQVDSRGLLVLLRPSFLVSHGLGCSSMSSQFRSKRGKRRRLSNVPVDPTEMLSGSGNCPCRKLAQRLRVPSASYPCEEIKPINSRQTITPVDEDMMPTDRMTDWENFALAIEASDDEVDDSLTIVGAPIA